MKKTILLATALLPVVLFAQNKIDVEVNGSKMKEILYGLNEYE